MEAPHDLIVVTLRSLSLSLVLLSLASISPFASRHEGCSCISPSPTRKQSTDLPEYKLSKHKDSFIIVTLLHNVESKERVVGEEENKGDWGLRRAGDRSLWLPRLMSV